MAPFSEKIRHLSQIENNSINQITFQGDYSSKYNRLWPSVGVGNHAECQPWHPLQTMNLRLRTLEKGLGGDRYRDLRVLGS